MEIDIKARIMKLNQFFVDIMFVISFLLHLI